MDHMDGKVRQRAQLKNYMDSCSGFLQKVISDLVLAQPGDARGFLVNALQGLPTSEFAIPSSHSELKLTGLSASGSNGDADSISRQVVLTVDVAQHKKEQALEILKSLQTFARTMDQCVRFEIFSEVDSESLMVLQSWKNEAGLHKYYNSEAFRAASAQFRDAQVLIRPPDFREYVVTD